MRCIWSSTDVWLRPANRQNTETITNAKDLSWQGRFLVRNGTAYLSFGHPRLKVSQVHVDL